jgi:hypothetical protein
VLSVGGDSTEGVFDVTRFMNGNAAWARKL